MDLADLIEELERQKKNSLDLRSLLGRSQMILETSGFLREIVLWWTGRDLNPRPRRCQRRDHSRLIYPPSLGFTYSKLNV